MPLLPGLLSPWLYFYGVSNRLSWLELQVTELQVASRPQHHCCRAGSHQSGAKPILRDLQVEHGCFASVTAARESRFALQLQTRSHGEVGTFTTVLITMHIADNTDI